MTQAAPLIPIAAFMNLMAHVVAIEEAKVQLQTLGMTSEQADEATSLASNALLIALGHFRERLAKGEPADQVLAAARSLWGGG